MNAAVTKIMSKLAHAEKTVHVKLLGDSITHGVGGTGFMQNGEPIVAGFSRNPDGYCWAKKFKDFAESNFNCTVTNNGCTGTKIEFVIENFDTLVDEEDNIIFCMIGTNNRHQYKKDAPMRDRKEMLDEFYGNILKLHEKFKATGKDFIMAVNIPASAANEKDGPDLWRILHMNDLNDLYTMASIECGFPFISMYSLFIEDCKNRGIDFESLLCDGLHPSDEGYDVMYRLFMKEFGFEIEE